MNDVITPDAQPEKNAPRWQPLGSIDRRVAGVLVEKAKTTPDAYPMSIKAITTACNQKSNRAPVMNLDDDRVEESLDRLREIGAVGMIEGYGRVTKYRHYLYEWLGVDKVELAVMAELLLRGPQTVGELRGRAARMEPIADLAAVQPILVGLKQRGLVLPLTPEGRGHVVTHALYPEKELEHLREQYGRAAPAAVASHADHPQRGEPPRPTAPPTAPSASSASPADVGAISAMGRQIETLRAELSELRAEFDQLSERQQQSEAALRELRDALGG